ncbi:MAG: urease accessory protein UreD [Methylohalobius sp. ZOD2]
MVAVASQGRGGWSAGLRLGFEKRPERTVLAARRRHGPLLVQRPFYPEGGVCHAYLLHPPGGVVAGDRLEIEIEAGADAQVLATTPAAGKFYRSEGATAHQTVNLSVSSGAALEWLPQENIFYQGARAAVETTVNLREGARFIGWEGFCLGRPAAGEGFERGRVRLGCALRLEGEPLLVERFELNREALAATWGLRGNPCGAALYAYPATQDLVERVRGLVGDKDGFGATLVDGVLICRGWGRRMDSLWRLFMEIWSEIRPGVVGRPACPPRIWAT